MANSELELYATHSLICLIVLTYLGHSCFLGGFLVRWGGRGVMRIPRDWFAGAPRLLSLALPPTARLRWHCAPFLSH